MIKKLTTADWSCIIDKVSKKLQGWVGNLLSFGGRLTLVNSILSAVPLCMLSLYKMPVNVRKQIDRIRRRFLRQGNVGPRKKYSLVNWDLICYPKEYGGLGVKDLHLMNLSLLVN